MQRATAKARNTHVYGSEVSAESAAASRADATPQESAAASRADATPQESAAINRMDATPHEHFEQSPIYIRYPSPVLHANLQSGGVRDEVVTRTATATVESDTPPTKARKRAADASPEPAGSALGDDPDSDTESDSRHTRERRRRPNTTTPLRASSESKAPRLKLALLRMRKSALATSADKPMVTASATPPPTNADKPMVTASATPPPTSADKPMVTASATPPPTSADNCVRIKKTVLNAAIKNTIRKNKEKHEYIATYTQLTDRQFEEDMCIRLRDIVRKLLNGPDDFMNHTSRHPDSKILIKRVFYNYMQWEMRRFSVATNLLKYVMPSTWSGRFDPYGVSNPATDGTTIPYSVVFSAQGPESDIIIDDCTP